MGYVTGRALPNEALAAKKVLKDYTNGKLLFCHLRPDYNS
jgi:ribosome biogenesis GTPase A